MFFNSWEGLLRIILVGVPAYVLLVAILVISGKRTLTQMNAFDFVITVAFGSALATIILSKDVALVEGILALTLLVILQFIVTWFSVRSKWMRNLVKTQPTLLYHKGAFLEDALLSQRLPRQEVYSAVREGGFASMESVMAIVLETNGNLTVLPYPADGEQPTALRGVANHTLENAE